MERARLLVVLLAFSSMVMLTEPSDLSAQTVPLSGPLAFLVGPLTPMGISAYDLLQLTQGAAFTCGSASSHAYPEFAGDNVGSNFYDLALSLYLLYYRTGDTAWRDCARLVAKNWRDDPLNQNINAYLSGNYSLSVPPPRSFSTLGLAIFALEAGDSSTAGLRSTATIVNDQARLGEIYFSRYTGSGCCDTREAAYSLTAQIAATLLGYDHRPAASSLLNSFLAAQQPNGCWQDTQLNLVPAGPYVLNYMQGLLMETMILYDRAIGDSRIVPAMQACVAWEWATQWVPGPTATSILNAFQYAEIDSGFVNTKPYANLNGLLLPAWGYLYQKTGNAAYKAQGDQILAGLISPGPDGSYGIYEVKQFDQMFRSSPRYLGWTAGTKPTTPTNLTVR